MTDILLLSRYGYQGASSRYRSYQYLPFLRQQGFAITVAPLLDDTYVQGLVAGRRTSLVSILQSYLKRMSWLVQTGRYDLVWVEKEALPWVPAWFELMSYRLRIPLVVDYDDALFHRYDQHYRWLVRLLLGKKIDRVMRRATLVIAGNQYLAQRALSAGATRIKIIPSVVDLDRYPPSSLPCNRIFTIGWIGSPSTARYLREIQPALREICQDGSARVIAIGANGIDLPGIPLTIKTWSEATEVQELQTFDVGIMPLPDTPWERGKCGLKLIQYMACSRPVVGSPVGVNSQIITEGANGFLPRTQEEWVQALQKLQHDRLLRQRMGMAGRQLVENQYSLQVTAPTLAQVLREVGEKDDFSSNR
jgi:glycosyltransferase involved in cell wall biosynthesis